VGRSHDVFPRTFRKMINLMVTTRSVLTTLKRTCP
jgi:hypothetical protein